MRTNHLAFAGIHDPAVYVVAENQGSGDVQTFNSGPGIPLISPGDDLQLTFARTGSSWSLAWDNLSQPSASGSSPLLTIPWLDGYNDLYMGVFVATPGPGQPTFVTNLDEFSINIQRQAVEPVPEPASIALWSLLSVAGLVAWRRRGKSGTA
jgi:MYXO-CTERM domain-containing protein